MQPVVVGVVRRKFGQKQNTYKGAIIGDNVIISKGRAIVRGGPFSISGIVTGGTLVPLDDFGITFTGTGTSIGQNYTTTSIDDGSYSVEVIGGWSGTSSATDTDNWHLITDLTYTIIHSDQIDQDLIAGWNYYVATTGNNNYAGTIDAPFATLSKAVQVVTPGDNIYMRVGIYTGWSSIIPTVSGTAYAPITITNYNGETVVISQTPGSYTYFLDLRNGLSFWNINDLEVENFAVGFYIRKSSVGQPEPHDFSFNNIITHDMGQALHANGWGWLIRSGSYNVTISNCEIYNCAGPGILIGDNCHDVLIEDTTSHDNDDGLGTEGDADGFTVDKNGSLYPYNITFRRCEAYNNSEDGIDVKADNVIIDSCNVHNVGACCYKLWSISIGTPPGVKQTTFTVMNCLGYGAGEATIRLASAPVVTLLNNSFIQTGEGTSENGEQTFIVAENASYNYWTGNLYSRNNIFIHLGTEAAATCAMDYDNTTWVLDMDYDVFMTPNYANSCIIRRSISDVYYTPTQIESGAFASAEGIESHARGIVPSFVDLVSDFHLTVSDSIARDTGTDTTSLGVTQDLDGIARPQNLVFDRGCYEYH